MASVIRELAVRLALESENFNNGLKSAQREAREFEKSIKPSMQAAKDFGIALTAAGVAVAGGMLAMTKAAADYGDAINKASVQTGISTEELSKLKFVADQTETSFAGVSNGLKFLTKNAAAAADGTKLQEKAFKELGVAVTDSTGTLRPMNSLLLDVADKFALMEDGTEKAALAQRIFGKSGMEMIPILNLGSEGIRKLGAEAEAAGLVLSAKAAKAGDDFNDAMTAVKASVLGLSNAIAQSLMPGLTDSSSALKDGIQAITAFAKEHETLTKAIFGTALAIAGVGGLLLAIAALAAASGPIWMAIAAVKAFSLSLMGFAAANAPLLMLAALAIAFWKLREALDASNKAQDDLLIHLSEAAASTERAAKALKDKYNIEIPKGTKSTQEWAEALGKAAQAAGKQEQATKTLAAVVSKTGQFAQRLAEERAADSKDSDKQFALYKKNIEETEVKQKANWKLFVDSHRAMTAVTFDLTSALSVHRTREHQMFEDSERDRDDALAGWRSYSAFRVELERSTNTQLGNELKANTDARVAAILKGKADDQRNWDEQIGIDAARNTKRLAAELEESQKWQRVWENAMGNVVSGFASGVADMILEGKNFGETMKGIFKELASTIIEVLVTDAFTRVAKGLSGILGVGGGSGNGSSSGSGGGLLGWLGGLFGGSKGFDWQGPIMPGASSAGGSAGGAAGGSSSMVNSLISGSIAAVGSIAGAMMGEGNFRRTEENTRETRDWLELQTVAWNPLMHQMEHLLEFTVSPLLREIKDILWEIRVGGEGNVINMDGRQVAVITFPHLLNLSTLNGVQVTGVR